MPLGAVTGLVTVNTVMASRSAARARGHPTLRRGGRRTGKQYSSRNAGAVDCSIIGPAARLSPTAAQAEGLKGLLVGGDAVEVAHISLQTAVLFDPRSLLIGSVWHVAELTS